LRSMSARHYAQACGYMHEHNSTTWCPMGLKTQEVRWQSFTKAQPALDPCL
jgi:hypothetical protein